MHKRFDYDKSYGLEENLSKSIERFRDSAEKQRKMKVAIRAVRRTRREVEQVPDEVKQWFEDNEEYEENEEEKK